MFGINAEYAHRSQSIKEKIADTFHLEIILWINEESLPRPVYWSLSKSTLIDICQVNTSKKTSLEMWVLFEVNRKQWLYII